MKPRHRRLAMVAGGVAALGIAATLVFSALNRNLVFFFTPSQVAAKEAPVGRAFRIGGLVEAGTVKRQGDGRTVHFVVTDTAQRIPVVFQGLLPDLFREGKGVVTQGSLDANGVFHATEVLAKHDENYTPVEAAYAIKNAQDAGERAARTVSPGP
ncbi:MAG: cytochrome c maturation protein CcmE [Betaproteobacteria bacterium]|nr:cytochrome c maturation protein CcmE [Betaproteobacteria bacterium]